jgi:hypothetical protein
MVAWIAKKFLVILWNPQRCYLVGFEVLRAVVMNNSFFVLQCHIDRWKSTDVFRRTCRLHLEYLTICHARNRNQAVNKQGYYHLFHLKIFPLVFRPRTIKYDSNAMQFGHSLTFRKNLSPSACDKLSSADRVLPLVTCLACPFTLKMEAKCTCDTFRAMR